MLINPNHTACSLVKPTLVKVWLVGAITLIALAAISGYLLWKGSQAPIAYLLVGTGGAIFAGALLYSIFHYLTQKKSLINTPSTLGEQSTNTSSSLSPESLEAKAPIIPIDSTVLERKEIIIEVGNQYFDPHSEKIFNRYANHHKTKKSAHEYLARNGKEYGDYTIFQEERSDRIEVLYINREGKIIEETLVNPRIWHGNIYKSTYEHLHYPLFPFQAEEERSLFHNFVLGLKYIALLKTFDGSHLANFPIGIFHRFLNWFKSYPFNYSLKFNPQYFLKIIGHIFGLSGRQTYTYQSANAGREQPCEIVYEGLNATLGQAVIGQDMIEYLSSSRLDPEIKRKIEQMATHIVVAGEQITDETLKILMTLLNQGIPISIMTGWEGHSVNLTLTKTHLLYTNKGAGSGLEPGQHLYSIGKEIDESILKSLCSQNTETFFPSCNGSSSPSTLETLLQLKCIQYFPSAGQLVGNCVFASNQFIFKSALLLLGIDEQIADKESKQYAYFSAMFWLDSLFVLINKLGHDENLNRELCFLALFIATKYFCKKAFTAEADQVFLSHILEKINQLNSNVRDHHYLKMVKNLDSTGKLQLDQVTKEHQQILIKYIFNYWMHKSLKNQKIEPFASFLSKIASGYSHSDVNEALKDLQKSRF